MFTGIITDIGTIIDIARRGDTCFRIATRFDTAGIDLGASIACAGICLTVTQTGPDWFAVEASTETLSCTTAQYWDVGRRLNLERALRVGDELGGHWVSGHVDGLARLLSLTPEGDSHRLEIEAPQAFAPFIARKGSVTLDGVSLTVNEVAGPVFGINIIPHTWTATTLGRLVPGDEMNLEIDLMARYVARQLQFGHLQGNPDHESAG